ncbi:MAG: dihydroorotate dehydrogenase electron transfer subunit [Candidatus Omnitrophica bacterium]|nr:dihydroorotate dehydrogenase electron transfer subunit [Candidatus Omnitrophota bacterium]
MKRNCFHLEFEAPGIARAALPGQFVMIRSGEGLHPLLRRPFSIHGAGNRRVEVLYEVVGQGTELLSNIKPGELLDVIGPLGNGFSCNSRSVNHGQILVAGGMGAAPLLFLAEKMGEIKTSGLHSPVNKGRGRIKVLVGARTKGHVLCEKEFKKCGCDVTIATDDGSRGFKGLVTDLLASILSTVNRQPSTIFACGPKPMLKAVSGIARKHGLAAQLSLEAHMACGIGACLGCVINTKTGYRRVCKEGPVFDSSDIIW